EVYCSRRCFMDRSNKKRWILRLTVVLIVGLVALVWSLREHGRTITILNRSEQAIAELSITIAGQTQTFQNVKLGDEITDPCPARGDDRYTIEGRLANGNRVRSSGRIDDNLDFILIPGGQLERRSKARR